MAVAPQASRSVAARIIAALVLLFAASVFAAPPSRAATTTIVSLTISYRAAQKRGDDLKAARLAHEIDGEIENYKKLLGLD